MIRIKKEPRDSKKKFRAIFPDGKHVSFGLRGYSDYTLHKDPLRMKRYVLRHGGIVPRGSRSMLDVKRSTKENWSPKGVRTAGFWSRWLLWSSPSLERAARHASRAAGTPVVLLK